MTSIANGPMMTDLDDLDAALIAAGVRFFSAAELLRIRYPATARRAGFAGPTFPLGSRREAKIERLVAVALVADQLRVRLDQPITVVNGYRPRKYNAAVHGAPNSQHLHARAMDLTCKDARALQRLAWALYHEDNSPIRGLGLYANGITHIDVRPEKRHAWGNARPS